MFISYYTVYVDTISRNPLLGTLRGSDHIFTLLFLAAASIALSTFRIRYASPSDHSHYTTYDRWSRELFPARQGTAERLIPQTNARLLVYLLDRWIGMASIDAVDEGLIASVSKYVEAYMANYDGSHDFHHIQRVLGLAKYIHAQAPNAPERDLQVVVLSALLHDVGDKKYLKPGEDASSLVNDLLISYGATDELARKVQTVCLGVSYSSEIKDPARVQELIKSCPELAVVQDADRLDAIGSIGIGRVFTFTGARTKASMADSIQHFHDKLLKLQSMMKTDVGRQLAEERTRRMKEFLRWWGEEAAFSGADGIPTLA
ncbi:hypothetical protein ANO14919_023230 [Xylariales sp. No.14919]|nr:hypothetical protein ANO14919_023230 [Xylariales sp. No.14919]